YITDASAYDAPRKEAHIYETGRAFGEFQRLLYDFPADMLHATIPDFHNTTRRFYTFVASVAADKAGRVRYIENEIEFMFEHRKLMNGIVTKLDKGELPLRVTHNDTKINTILIDNATDKALCVIDLDTVMPGSSLYDFGDAIRFCASTAAEDEPDTTKISLDMNAFKLFTEGFLSETNGFLDPEEIRALPLGVLVITCELAMRFLTDYIDGDLYFKVNYPEHNLVRARAQIALLRDMETKYDEMCRIGTPGGITVEQTKLVVFPNISGCCGRSLPLILFQLVGSVEIFAVGTEGEVGRVTLRNRGDVTESAVFFIELIGIDTDAFALYELTGTQTDIFTVAANKYDGSACRHDIPPVNRE
ncbi:MAG: phosphotransferase, partial [Clostridia bacterium]|nr:phosphotransferase [Clostridia bacterium]